MLPDIPAGVTADAVHETASMVNSVSIRLLRRIAETDQAATGLTGPKASALSVLVYGGPRPIGELAAIEQVTPAAMTKTVDALEAAGLARRDRSGDDRRVVRVETTAAGREALERGRSARVEVLARLLADATDDDLELIRQTMNKLADLL
jgi:DNA-binding MarR family transcriptional regulator